MSNAEIHVLAYRGVHALTERQRAITKEHVERKKKLIALMDAVNKGEQTGELKLEGDALELSPELSDLLENPVHGL